MVMARKKWVQVSILIVLIAATAYTIGTNLSAGSAMPKVGDKAPNFQLYDMDGNLHELKDYLGKPVVVNFWGSFCPPCVRELPLIQEKYEDYMESELVVLGVNIGESMVAIQHFLSDKHVTFPILLDKDIVRRQYGVKDYPTTFFIDAAGTIKQIIVGEMSVGGHPSLDLDIAIRRLLYG
jgi:peroxiredoxin